MDGGGNWRRQHVGVDVIESEAGGHAGGVVLMDEVVEHSRPDQTGGGPGKRTAAARPQGPDHSTHDLEGVGARLLDPGERLACDRWPLLGQELSGLGLHHHAGDVVGDQVVQLSRQVEALVAAGRGRSL